jgi:hypothetical protein
VTDENEKTIAKEMVVDAFPDVGIIMYLVKNGAFVPVKVLEWTIRELEAEDLEAPRMAGKIVSKSARRRLRRKWHSSFKPFGCRPTSGP